MKAIILYAQETPSLGHQMMHVVSGKGSATLYLRAEIVDDDPDFALDKAAPQDGEIVLNAVPYPSENVKAHTSLTEGERVCEKKEVKP